MSLILIAIILSGKIASGQPDSESTMGCDVIRALQNLNETEAIRLVENGANANFTDSYKRTPMLLAAEYGYEKLIKVLLKNNYTHQIRATDGFGDTPLNAAARRNRDRIVELLIKSGCNDINAAEYMPARNPLRNAADNGNLKMVKLLVEHGADVHDGNWIGETARDVAEKAKHWRVVDYLELVGNQTLSSGRSKMMCT